jgi:hypothetical protein
MMTANSGFARNRQHPGFGGLPVNRRKQRSLQPLAAAAEFLHHTINCLNLLPHGVLTTHKRKTNGVGSAPRLDLSFNVEAELFAEEQILLGLSSQSSEAQEKKRQNVSEDADSVSNTRHYDRRTPCGSQHPTIL